MIFNFRLYFLFVTILPVLVAPMEIRKGCQIPGPGVLGGCEPPCGCCESNLGPLGEHQIKYS